MVKVITKDRGSKYSALSSLIAGQANALQAHNTELSNEISTHSGHAYSRHGYQAGWEQQLIRVVSEVTPDQTFDPTGVGAVTREWNPRWIGNASTGSFEKLVTTYDSSGNTVIGAAGSSSSVTLTYATASGVEAGGFYSPEAQQMALTRATAVANNIAQYEKFNIPGIAKDWKKLDKVLIVVDALPGAGYGIGYRRKSSFTSRTRDQVLELIEHFHRRSTWNTVDPTTYPSPVSNGIILLGDSSNQDIIHKSVEVAFPNLHNLLTYLHVEAFWQINAVVIFKRTDVNAVWQRVTMFPVDWSPASWAPATKVPGKPWSGMVKLASGAIQTLIAPPWTPQ
jgi:hypothetical protein